MYNLILKDYYVVCSFGAEIQTGSFIIYNINEVKHKFRNTIFF